MNTTDLRNCDISIYGKFVWSADNIQYWLSHSFSVTYAGRSTAWLFGGTNVSMRGYGKAPLRRATARSGSTRTAALATRTAAPSA